MIPWRRLSRATAYSLVGVTMFALLAGANLPAPIYEVYRRAWHLSDLEMTAVFATYPLTLVAGSIAFARLSDRFGRRPLLLAALVAGIGGALLFALATSTGWLYAGRWAQAIAVSLLGGAGTAALVELQPAGDRARATLTATIALSLGTAVGPLVAGLFVAFGPAPRTLIFWIYAIVSAALLPAVARLPESSPRVIEGKLLRAPRVPRRVARAFIVAATTSGAGWLAASLFFSVVPSYARTELNVTSPALHGALAFATLATSALVQLGLRRMRASLAIGIGLTTCTVGLGLLVAAVPLHLWLVLVAAALVCGAGHAFCVVGSLALANKIASPEKRGELLSLYYAVTYLLVGVPALGVGAIATDKGFFVALAALLCAYTVVAVAIGALNRSLVSTPTL